MRPPPEAFYDVFFLLSRGYPRSHALSLVAARHHLSRPERILIGRCVHGAEESRTVRSKLSPCCRNRCLVVDVFNQLATIYAALSGHRVYRCSDGLTRDALLGATGLVVRHAQTLADLASAAVASLAPRHVYLVVDSQPSRSAVLASALREAHTRRGLPAAVLLEKKADRRVIELGRTCVAATSDIVVARRVTALLDLAGYAIRLFGLDRAVTDITRLLSRHHSSWCRVGGPVA